MARRGGMRARWFIHHHAASRGPGGTLADKTNIFYYFKKKLISNLVSYSFYLLFPIRGN